MALRRTVLLLLATAAALLVAACRAGDADDLPAAARDPGAYDGPVVVAARMVCRLVANNPSAAAAQIIGVDGAPSVVAGGRGYWFFGDTVRRGPGGREDVIPASVATSGDRDGRDCVRLTFKTTAGIAQPMFPRGDETTAWPDGVLPLDDGSILFYMVKAYRESPFLWHVGAVGLGRIPPGSTTGERSVERIWDGESGFGARIAGVRSALRLGDDILVFIRTDAGANYAARAPLADAGDAAAYRYWDGDGWSVRPADARALWENEPSTLPPDNGVTVNFDERSGRWLAVYNGHLASLQARTADEPWGPWSEPATWLDCRGFVGQGYPYCYSAELHPELSDDPSIVYVTFSSSDPYDVTLLALHLGAAIHAWLRDDGALRYAAEAPGDDYRDDGLAFYASSRPAPELAPVYEREHGAGYGYEFESPGGDAQPAFYAYAIKTSVGVPLRPVYRWRRDGVAALDGPARDGWQRGDVAFYVPCLVGLPEDPACRQ